MVDQWWKVIKYTWVGNVNAFEVPRNGILIWVVILLVYLTSSKYSLRRQSYGACWVVPGFKLAPRHQGCRENHTSLHRAPAATWVNRQPQSPPVAYGIACPNPCVFTHFLLIYTEMGIHPRRPASMALYTSLATVAFCQRVTANVVCRVGMTRPECNRRLEGLERHVEGQSAVTRLRVTGS